MVFRSPTIENTNYCPSIEIHSIVINDGIQFGGSHEIELVGYYDADFAGNIDNRRSTSGYVFFSES